MTAVASRLVETAHALAQFDALLSLAEIAVRGDWVAPDSTRVTRLRSLEAATRWLRASLAGEPFIDNDCRLGADGGARSLLTGPNMGGKSTFLRQTALIVLLAQIGLFVPAKRGAHRSGRSDLHAGWRA